MGIVRNVPLQAWIGLALAFASALVTNTAYSFEHDAAAALPPLSPRRPFRTVESLLEDRRWLKAFGTETAGWLLYVAALRLAPLALRVHSHWRRSGRKNCYASKKREKFSQPPNQ